MIDVDELGTVGDVRRATWVDQAVQLGDVIPPVAAGPEQQQLHTAWRGRVAAHLSDPSAHTRNGVPANLVDGEATLPPIRWSTPAPPNVPELLDPLQLPPVPIAASPAGWDGEPSLHAPPETRIVMP